MSHRQTFHQRLQSTALAAVLLLGLPNIAQADHAESDRAYRQGYNLVLDENWQGAIQAFEALIDLDPVSEWVDDAAFWRCYARQQLGQPAAEVFSCFEQHLEQHEGSEWGDDVRRTMVRLAGQLDREGRPEYREKVRDLGGAEDHERLLAILMALGDVGDERSLDVVLKRLDTTDDEHVRVRIVEILEDFDSPRAFEKLKSLVRTDPSQRIRIAAIDALSDHQSADVLALLTELFRDTSLADELRVEALEELADHEVPGLAQLLKEVALGGNDALALEAIDELGDMEGDEPVRVLVEILGKTPVPRRRVEVLDSLEDFQSDIAVAALLQVARNDPDPRMRRAATESLGDMETEAGREALIQLLEEIE